MALALFVLFMAVLPQAAAQSALSIDEFKLPNDTTSIDAMAIDGMGNVWLAQSSPAVLYEYVVSADAFVKHAIPTATGAMINGMSVQGDKYVWMADQGGNQVIGYDIASGKFYNFSFPLTLGPSDVIAQDRYLWVGCNMELGRIDIDTNFLDDYYVDKYDADVADLAVDRLGDVWFVEYASDKVGGYSRMDDKVRLYPIPTSGSKATCLGVDSRERLWFVESGPNQLGMFDTNHDSFQELSMPVFDGRQAVAKRLAVDDDDNVWITDMVNNRVVKYYPEKSLFVPIALNGSKVYPTFIGTYNNNVWFVESGTRSLARLQADSLFGLNPTPTPTPLPTSAPNATATPTPTPTPGFGLMAVMAAVSVLALIKRSR